MDGWLKFLIATACVVVIAGGGYYAWSEHTEANKRAALSDRRLHAASCGQRVRDIKSGRLSGDDFSVLQDCVIRGALGERDMQALMQSRFSPRP